MISREVLRKLPGPLGYAVFRDGATRRRIGHWLRSLDGAFDPVGEGVPWITYQMCAWLERILRPGTRVFEWGAGGSTVYFGCRVDECVSVEHDVRWHRRVAGALGRHRAVGCRILLVPPEADDPLHPAPWPVLGYEPWVGWNFASYVAAIDAFPDRHFDLILVDGRERVACGERAIAKVRPGGHLVLDDSQRSRYGRLRDRLAGCPRFEFRGLAPVSLDIKSSTVWRIE